MRSEPALLLILLLLLATVPGGLGHTGSHDASRVQPTGDLPTVLGDPNGTADALAVARDAGLFGAFTREGSHLRGALVTATLDPGNGSVANITLQGTRILDEVATGLDGAQVHVDGPATVLNTSDGALTLHDNRYAWFTLRGNVGNVTLQLPPGDHPTHQVPGGSTRLTYDANGTTVHVVRLDGGRLHGVNGTIEAPARGDHTALALATELGVLEAPQHDLATGPWVLAAHANGTTVTDVLRPLGSPHEVQDAAPDRLDLHVVSSMDRDTVTRMETVGLHAVDDPQRYLTMRGDHVHRSADAQRLWTAGTGSSLHHATVDGDVVRFLARLPAGQTGDVSLVRDTAPPEVTEVLLRNLTEPWDPTKRVPLLVLRTSEHATVTLRLLADGTADPVEKRTTLPALAHRFRLVGLHPNTTYTYTANLTDLAGRTATFEGTLTTPPRPDAAPLNVTLLEPEDGSTRAPGKVTVRALVQGDGTVNVFVDKTRLPSDAVTHEGSEVYATTGSLAPGAHEVTVEVTTGGERAWDRASFTVEQQGSSDHGTGVLPVPGPGIALLLAALLVTGRALRRRP